MFKNRGTRELVKGLMNLAFSLEKIGLMILMSVSIENGGKFLTVPLAGLPGADDAPTRRGAHCQNVLCGRTVTYTQNVKHVSARATQLRKSLHTMNLPPSHASPP